MSSDKSVSSFLCINVRGAETMINRNISNINRNEFTVLKLITDFLVYQQYENNSPATISYYKTTLEIFTKYLDEQGIAVIDDVNINPQRPYTALAITFHQRWKKLSLFIQSSIF